MSTMRINQPKLCLLVPVRHAQAGAIDRRLRLSQAFELE